MATTITIELQGNPAQIQAQKEVLQKLASLPADDRNRISELISSAKALAALKSKWTMLKLMFT